MSYVTGPKPASDPRGTAPAGAIVSNYTIGGNPRNGGYTSGGGMSDGLYAWPKPGKTVLYYYGSDGKEQVKGNKDNEDPTRKGDELVGVTTGKSAVSSTGLAMVEVEWVQRWYTARFLWFGTKGENRNVLSWVRAEDIELRTAQTITPPVNGGGVNPYVQNPGTTNPPAGDGDNTDTLLYAGAGLAAVMLLTPKKKRK